MPVSGTYTWTETPEAVELTVSLKGASFKSLDVLLTETFVKVTYPPFLLDLNLLKSVEESRSKAIRKDGVLYIELVKKEKGIWGHLLFDGTKEEIAERRRKALDARTEMVRALHEKAREKKYEEGRMTVRKQVRRRFFV